MAYTYTTYTLPDTYISDPNIGWNSGAVSNPELDNNATYQFDILGTVAGVVTGISPPEANLGYGYAEIEFAFHIAGEFAKVMENGVVVSASFPVHNSTFQITRIGTNVTYRIDGVLVHTSSRTPTYPFLLVDASLYSGGDAIYNAAIYDVYTPTVDIATTSVLGAVSTKTMKLNAGFSTSSALAAGVRVGNNVYIGANIATDSVLDTSIHGSKGFSVAITTNSVMAITTPYIHNNTGYASLAPLQSLSSNYRYTQSTAAFEALKATSTAGLLLPETATSSTSLAGLISTGHGLTGEVATATGNALAPLNSIAADHAYGESTTSFYGLLSLSGQYIPFDAIGDLYAPAFKLIAKGTEGGLTAAYLDLPTVSLQAQGGSGGILAAPKVVVAATGTNDPVARLTAALPHVSSQGSVLSGVVASGTMDWRYSLSITGYTGGYAKLDVPKFSASGATNSGTIATAVLTSPIVTAYGEVFPSDFGRATLDVPVVSSLYGVGYLGTPAITLSGSIFTAPTGYTAYSMNIANNAMSVYPSYRFDYLLRFNGTYYGVLNNTLFSLDGATDNGLNIDSNVELAVSDLGTTKLKRLPYTYIGGRANSDIVVEPVADEKIIGSYTAVALDRVGTRTRRVTLPRGARGRYWGVRISNVNGDALDIDQVTYKIDVLARNV